MKTFILCVTLAQAAFGQFAVSRMETGAERPVGAVLDLGRVYPAEAATGRLKIRNVSATPAAVTALAINGTGFSLSGVPKLPAGLGPDEAFEFFVVFQATPAASYSAILEADGIAILVTAAVLPGLTHSIGASGLAFGTVEAGTSRSTSVSVANLTGFALPFPPLATSGDAFSIANAPDGATVLQPSDSVSFDIVFHPAGAGTWTGTLAIGERKFPLTGTAVGPALPKPILRVDLPEARSGQTGSVSVRFDGPAKNAGAGTLTLAFEPLVKGATDPAIQLGVVGPSLPFTVAVGDTRLPAVNFQTGTTAGTITIAAELGGSTDSKSIVIPPAPIGILAAGASRATGSIDIRLTGFDNTRTAGPVVYTFFDASAAALPPIAVDNTRDFAGYFAGSDAGGAFVLRAVFPVTGDTSKITAFEARMTNSAGSTSTGRISF